MKNVLCVPARDLEKDNMSYFVIILNNDLVALFRLLSDPTSTRPTSRQRVREAYLWRRIKGRHLNSLNGPVKNHNPLVLSVRNFVWFIWAKTG